MTSSSAAAGARLLPLRDAVVGTCAMVELKIVLMVVLIAILFFSIYLTAIPS
jgi:hypothetical protein